MAIDSDAVMIAAVGAKPRRVAHNVKYLRPETLVVLDQLKEGWSEKDSEYNRNVLDKFFRYPHIRDLHKKNRLVRWPVQDLTDDAELFSQLFRLLRRYADRSSIDIDTTAMPRRSTVIAIVVASMFSNASCWAAGKKGYGRYSLKSYPNPNEEGSDPLMIPLLRGNITLLKDPSSARGRVFNAIYGEFLNRRRKGTRSPAINESSIRQTVKGLSGTAVTQSLTALKNDGWLIDKGEGDYALSPFAVYLGGALEEEMGMKYEEETDIKKLIVEMSDVIRRQAERFKTYPGMSEERIRNWLLQFPSRRTAEIGLKLLERVDYLDMQKIRDFIRHFYDKLSPDEKEKAIFVVMGKLADSSDLISYYLSHEVKGLGFSQLQDVITQASIRSVVLLDDCLISSTQSTQIFGEWLGTASSSKYVTKLTHRQISRLKQLNISFHVIVGTEEGKKRLTEYLQKQGFTASITASRTLRRQYDSCFTYGSSPSSIFQSKEEMERAKQEFYRLGKMLLLDRAQRERWLTEQLETNCLGYGDWQLLLVFQHNTPTATLPIFWEQSYLDGREWLPLFPRR